MKLVLVESPAKSKTILKCLGKGYKVMATMGHLRDLPKRKLGIDIENNFEPTYSIIRGRADTLKKIKTQAKKAEMIYLACDLDREGEAIAWHVMQALKLPDDKFQRVTFNEITPQAIKAAFKNPGQINMSKVNAQQARRLLDRLVGYKLSPLLWKKIAKGLSAGRVQSVAVRLIVEREKQIQAFKSQEYWEIDASLRSQDGGEPFTAELYRLKGEKPAISNEEQAKAVLSTMEKQPFIVSGVEKKRTRRKPSPPFITSLLQQRASTQLRYSAKRTMRIAQQLYEGIEIGEEGPVGLITYMRTDSFHIASGAISEVRKHIKEAHGENYIPERPNAYSAGKQAQEAHEAIRPTYVGKTPQDIKKYLSKDQMALYELIWRQFVASQMKPAIYDITNVTIDAGDASLKVRGRHMIFDGYTAVLGQMSKKEEQILPPIEEGQTLELIGITPRQCFTKPPPRYSEATLVRTLERRGIGRPSTYAPIISTIVDRGYVDLKSRAFHATELGILVIDKLMEFFADILDVKFTSTMEEHLDKVESNQAEWTAVLKEFYDPFEKDLNNAEEKMVSVKGEAAETDEKCPECGQNLLERWSRSGKFLGCKGFPDCKYTKSLEDDGLDEMVVNEPPCEKCGAKMVVKASRRGKFFACSGYPDCKNTRSIPTPFDCPKEGCDGKIVQRHSKQGRRFYGCSKYPDCDFTSGKLPKPEDESETEEDTSEKE